MMQYLNKLKTLLKGSTKWVLLVVVVALVLYVLDSKGLKKEIKELEKINKGLEQKYEMLEIENTQLDNSKQKEVVRYITVEKKLKEKTDEDDKIPNNVRSYSNSELDEYLTGYRTQKRN